MVQVSRGRGQRGPVSRVRKRKKPNPETLFLFMVAIPLALAALFWWQLRGPPKSVESISLPEIEAVRSTISELRDSLQVVVTWETSSFWPLGPSDSLRVQVSPESGYSEESKRRVLTSPTGDQQADTVYLPMPAPGQSVIGYSCAAVIHPGLPLDQSCTEWQYVRPSAVFDSAAGYGPARIVIQPRGLQVDPDVDGSCARWQRRHPNQSAWILINRTAVPDCTGPNLKPTVAKFCAFAVLPGGRRVKTANSTNDRYCDELFVEWAGERYS
jgi:hypothetical protein